MFRWSGGYVDAALGTLNPSYLLLCTQPSGRSERLRVEQIEANFNEFLKGYVNLHDKRFQPVSRTSLSSKVVVPSTEDRVMNA